MLPKFTHIFSKQLNNNEKGLIFNYIKETISESTQAVFITDVNTLECKIPFFVSRWNPYGIFDAIRCIFENTASGNTGIHFQTFHARAIIAKI